MQETVKGVEVSEEVPEDMDSASINDFDAEAQAFPEYMESLEQKGVYLSGPIRCVADNGKGWREDIINFPCGFQVCLQRNLTNIITALKH